MSKGSSSRPFEVDHETYSNNFDAIFGKKKTGWPEGMLQDDSSGLSRWLASKPDAREIVRQNIKEQENERPV